MTMNRRQFLKNMGIGAAGATLPGVSMFAANEAMNTQDKSLFKLPELHCDVIVVGADRQVYLLPLLLPERGQGDFTGRRYDARRSSGGYVCHIYVRCTPCRCIY